MTERRQWVDVQEALPVRAQCSLLQVNRAVFYQHARNSSALPDETDLLHLRLLDECYTAHPYYGSRRSVVWLAQRGYTVNRKRVRRLMQQLGLVAMAPQPDTSKKHPQHKVYPYLLRGMAITRPNQVWSTDITYVRLGRGFMYLTAILDWYSRKVLSWRISNTMDAGFCVECLEDALAHYGTPEIFNSDQGAQFTSEAFTQVLKEKGIRISMDGRGRALDNIFVERLWRTVKYEDIYLRGYTGVAALYTGLTNYFQFYNERRPHQSLGYATPSGVYTAAKGGGAAIPDKFSNAAVDSGINKTGNQGQRLSAANEVALS